MRSGVCRQTPQGVCGTDSRIWLASDPEWHDPDYLAAVKLVNPFLLGLALATACKRDPIFTEMSDSTYIRTMVALRQLPIGIADTTARARQRDSILRVMGVTAAQLESVAVRLSEDPARAAEIFRVIENPASPPPP